MRWWIVISVLCFIVSLPYSCRSDYISHRSLLVGPASVPAIDLMPAETPAPPIIQRARDEILFRWSEPVCTAGCHCWLVQQCSEKNTAGKLAVAPDNLGLRALKGMRCRTDEGGYGVVLATASPTRGLATAGPDRGFAERFDLPRDPDTVLREVLSRREFAEDPTSRWFRQLWDEALRTLAKILRWIVNRIPSMGPVKFTGDILGTIGTALLVGVAAVILILFGWRLGAAIAKRTWRRGADPVPSLESEDTQTPAGLRAQALREAEQGNFGRAVVLFFRYAILRLDEEGLLAYHPGKTNRELLTALTADDAVRRRVGEMVRLFNRVRYGRTTCGRNDYERFLMLCRNVLGEV